jgi:predicted nucleotidyltransferase
MNDVTPAVRRPKTAVISEDILETLRHHGATKAYLFGSVATGLADEERDVDLYVAFGRPMTLFEQIDLAERLSELCGHRVDLATKIHPIFEPYIVPTLRPLAL